MKKSHWILSMAVGGAAVGFVASFSCAALASYCVDYPPITTWLGAFSALLFLSAAVWGFAGIWAAVDEYHKEQKQGESE
jgi:ABC-type multidrug transport system permease subunit